MATRIHPERGVSVQAWPDQAVPATPPAVETPAVVAGVRRVRDIVGAVTCLVLLAPILLVVAIAIRLDSPGPALFRQRRVGLGLKPFMVIKFRTMWSDSDAAPHREYVSALIDGEPQPGAEGLYKLEGDARVTRVGRLLRRWSVDEVPQLWNVLRGEMSLVGPRPVLAYEVERYPPWYFGRFRVRPGMTGLWQVSGRNRRTYEEMVALDVRYVATQSLRADAAILLRTVWVVVARRGVA
jgi:lipopolysaccharide/colanic/teichoic acid biosynthesis glycosyltransferase